MLVPSSTPPSAEELIARVRAWLNLLGDGQLEVACEQLDEANAYGIRWTPSSLTSTLRLAFGPESRFRREHPNGPVFSRVDDAPGDGRPSVVAFDDGSGYAVEHDVPLNGAFSDLTAQTEFRWRGNKLAFVLHDLHVL
jgi:hypothetical protein